MDKQLQTISNYFLFSLAVADITIGCISIPLMTYYTAMRHWGIGYAMCQFWLSVDYLMSNASVGLAHASAQLVPVTGAQSLAHQL